MALGEELRAARLAKKETTSEVAAATRMKIQIVEDLEKEEFGRIAAPIYGKGFIRLYAEHVGLDPHPLIADYLQKLTDARTPSLISDAPSQLAGPAPAAPAPAQDLFAGSDPEAPAVETNEQARRIPPKQRVHVPRPTGQVSAAFTKRREQVRHALSRWWAAVGTAARKATSLWSAEKMRSSPSRIASLVLAGIVVLVFLVSGITRIAGCRPRPEPVPPHTDTAPLFLVEEPPEPYLD